MKIKEIITKGLVSLSLAYSLSYGKPNQNSSFEYYQNRLPLYVEELSLYIDLEKNPLTKKINDIDNYFFVNNLHKKIIQTYQELGRKNPIYNKMGHEFKNYVDSGINTIIQNEIATGQKNEEMRKEFIEKIIDNIELTEKGKSLIRRIQN